MLLESVSAATDVQCIVPESASFRQPSRDGCCVVDCYKADARHAQVIHHLPGHLLCLPLYSSLHAPFVMLSPHVTRQKLLPALLMSHTMSTWINFPLWFKRTSDAFSTSRMFDAAPENPEVELFELYNRQLLHSKQYRGLAMWAPDVVEFGGTPAEIYRGDVGYLRGDYLHILWNAVDPLAHAEPKFAAPTGCTPAPVIPPAHDVSRRLDRAGTWIASEKIKEVTVEGGADA